MGFLTTLMFTQRNRDSWVQGELQFIFGEVSCLVGNLWDCSYTIVVWHIKAKGKTVIVNDSNCLHYSCPFYVL